MADGIDVDLSEFERLSVDLGRASTRVIAAARPVVKNSLDNIKKDTVAHINDDYWAPLKRLVSYDVVGLDGEVGYEDRGQGNLAGIHDFGSATRAPNPTLYPAAEREAPNFEKAIGDIIDKVTL